MKTFLKPPVYWTARIITGVTVYITGFIFCYSHIYTFNYWVSFHFGIYFNRMNTELALIVGSIAFILFGALFWMDARALMHKPIHMFNYKLFAFFTAVFVLVMILLFKAFHPPFMMIFVPAVITAALLIFWGTTVVRLRSEPFREIENIARSFDIANEEKLKAERFKTELIANVSHDIRTPLTSIINYVDFIDRMEIDNPELAEYVTVLNKTAARLKTLIDDLLDASKAGTGNVSMNIQALDLSELLGQAVGEFDSAFSEKNLTYISKHTEDKVFVAADGKHLFRVFENLFSNVAKYSMPETRVYVEIEETEGAVSLSIKNVSDRQLEVSPEMLMERFVQGESSRNTEGNGLGLYIAKYLLEGMGGKLTVEINGDLFVATVTLSQATHFGTDSMTAPVAGFVTPNVSL